MRVAAVAAALLGCSLVAPHSVVAQLARPKIDTVGSKVVRVMNPGPTAWADTNGWKLVLERTIQPGAGQQGELENPDGIVLLRDGRVIISQHEPAMIRLYDAQGRFVRDIGRSGDGPAEYRKPVIAVVGDTVIAYNGASGRASLLTLDGKRVREFLTNAHYDGPPIYADTRGRLQVTGSRVSASAMGQQWIYFDYTGRRVDSMTPPKVVEPALWTATVNGGVARYNVPLAPRNVYAFRSDGALLFGADNRYQLFLTRNGKDTLLTFGRTGVPSTPVPSQLRDSLFSRFGANPQLAGVASKGDIPSIFPLWNEATIDGTGNFWVSTGRTSSRTHRFDVFNSSGRYLGAVAAPFSSFWRTSWTGDRVAVVGTDDNDLPRIRIYRIDRRGK